MKIAIISDTHDNVPNLEKFLAWAKENKIEQIIHCGDLCAPSILKNILLFLDFPLYFLILSVNISLTEIMTAAKDYVAKTNRKLMFEYIMIRGINDSQKQAKQLVDLLDNRLFFVNLIAYNRQGASLEPSSPVQIKKFKDILMRAGVQTLERYRFGQDIKGACGQLAAQNRA